MLFLTIVSKPTVRADVFQDWGALSVYFLQSNRNLEAWEGVEHIVSELEVLGKKLWPVFMYVYWR